MSEDPVEVHGEALKTERIEMAEAWIKTCMEAAPFPPNAVEIRVGALVMYDDGSASQIEVFGRRQDV